jgi:hypothetical protein
MIHFKKESSRQVKKNLNLFIRFFRKYFAANRLWSVAHISEQGVDSVLPSHNYHGPGSIRYSKKVEFSDYSGGSLGI